MRLTIPFLRRGEDDRPPLLLFDYDGVISDSMDVYFDEFTQACTLMGYDRLNSKEAFLALFDANLVTQLIRAGFPLRKLRALAEEFAPKIEAPNARIKPFPGMVKTLDTLSRRHPLLIITANAGDVVRRFVEQHELSHIREIVGSDEETSKVKRIRAARHRYRGHRAYYIGDTRGDMIEARRARALPVGVGWGWHDVKRLESGKPAHIVHTQEELLALFDCAAKPK